MAFVLVGYRWDYKSLERSGTSGIARPCKRSALADRGLILLARSFGDGDHCAAAGVDRDADVRRGL